MAGQEPEILADAERVTAILIKRVLSPGTRFPNATATVLLLGVSAPLEFRQAFTHLDTPSLLNRRHLEWPPLNRTRGWLR